MKDFRTRQLEEQQPWIAGQNATLLDHLMPRLFVKNGTAFLPTDEETVHIAFFPAEEAGATSKSYIVKFNRTDGTFRAIGKGMPPGKYRVAVSITKGRKDELKGAYNAKDSPLLCDVVSASKEITLDLATLTNATRPQTQPAKSTRKSRS
jgi:hypothetical protein